MNILTYSSLFDCFEQGFPGTATTICHLEEFGYQWEKYSIPFAISHDNHIIAHAGIVELPVYIEGQHKTFAVIHTVCTMPAFRQQGLATKVLKEALTYCKGRYDNVILYTQIPEFYLPFGFKVIEENYFQLETPSKKNIHKSKRELIPLFANNAEHRNLFKRIVSTRIPLSKIFSFLDSGYVIIFDRIITYPYLRNFYYSKDLDALIAYQLDDKCLKILDVISTKEIDLDALLSCFDVPFDRTIFYFSPDQFTQKAIPLPSCYESDRLMALDCENMPKKPFMAPPLTRI